MGISRNLSILAQGAATTGVLGTTKGGTGLATVGTNGQVLTSNGTALTWTTPQVVPTDVLTTSNWNTVGVGGSATIAAGGRYYASAGSTINLPASPVVGNQVTISVGQYTDVVIGNNGTNIMGFAQPMTINIANVSVTLEYVNTTQGWVVY